MKYLLFYFYKHKTVCCPLLTDEILINVELGWPHMVRRKKLTCVILVSLSLPFSELTHMTSSSENNVKAR